MNHTEGDTPYILVVDDIPANLQILVATLQGAGYRVRPVLDGRLALDVARREQPALVLMDINMPGMNGFETCAEFKNDPKLAAIPIIFLSANTDTTDKLRAFTSGGVDYVTKPFQAEEVNARVSTHLKIYRLQVELDRYNRSLQDMVQAQVKEISESQIATILALVKLSEFRDENTGNHILRVQRYCRTLAMRLVKEGSFGDSLDGQFPEDLFQASALHDIGKVGIPDIILLKPGQLTPDEFATMKNHTTLGAAALDSVLGGYPKNGFVRLGMQVARSHHERFDGSGYPDGLVGEDIPIAARILTLADQYDALRNKRPYKPGFDQARTLAIITEGDGRSDPKHLDPRVLAAFKKVAGEFDAIFEELNVTTT